jgi:hypothetical protein
MTWFLAGLLVAVLGVGWWAFERQRAVYEQLVDEVKNDRDGAYQEMRVYRGLLFPVVKMAEERKSVAGSTPASPAPLASSSTVEPAAGEKSGRSSGRARPRRRVPFRHFFNQARRETNTPQKSTDALASALELANQSKEKRSNVNN